MVEFWIRLHFRDGKFPEGDLFKKFEWPVLPGIGHRFWVQANRVDNANGWAEIKMISHYTGSRPYIEVYAEVPKLLYEKLSRARKQWVPMRRFLP